MSRDLPLGPLGSSVFRHSWLTEVLLLPAAGWGGGGVTHTHSHSTLSKNAHAARRRSGLGSVACGDSARGKSELHTSDWMPLCVPCVATPTPTPTLTSILSPSWSTFAFAFDRYACPAPALLMLLLLLHGQLERRSCSLCIRNTCAALAHCLLICFSFFFFHCRSGSRIDAPNGENVRSLWIRTRPAICCPIKVSQMLPT